ncbi:MAG: hypothetical protein HQ478_11040 [Chloroflexi bacterium]|nr:hypothetical protein [Chloroflexota bacterium]
MSCHHGGERRGPLTGYEPSSVGPGRFEVARPVETGLNARVLAEERLAKNAF